MRDRGREGGREQGKGRGGQGGRGSPTVAMSTMASLHPFLAARRSHLRVEVYGSWFMAYDSWFSVYGLWFMIFDSVFQG